MSRDGGQSEKSEPCAEAAVASGRQEHGGAGYEGPSRASLKSEDVSGMPCYRCLGMECGCGNSICGMETRARTDAQLTWKRKLLRL